MSLLLSGSKRYWLEQKPEICAEDQDELF